MKEYCKCEFPLIRTSDKDWDEESDYYCGICSLDIQ